MSQARLNTQTAVNEMFSAWATAPGLVKMQIGALVNPILATLNYINDELAELSAKKGKAKGADNAEG